MAEVQIHGLSKRFPNGNWGLADLNLQLKDGELLALLGPSGSGKTTLLRLIAGLETPSAGTIHFGGKDVTHCAPHQRSVAVVFQTPGLYPHWSVRQNLALGGTATGGSWNWLRRRETSPVLSTSSLSGEIEKVARVLGIDSLLDRFPAQLSGGEQQRVALGRGLLQQPAALLLDEPFAHLDGVLRRELRREVRRLQRERKCTTILVTHDPAEALQVCDQLAVIDQGQIAQIGPPQEIYDRPHSLATARWGGPEGMNLWLGQVANEAGSFTWNAGDWRVEIPPVVQTQAKPADELWLGIRPEHLACEQGVLLGHGSVADIGFVGEGWTIQIELASRQSATMRKSRSGACPNVGERVPIRVQTENCHWFSAKNGRRLN